MIRKGACEYGLYPQRISARISKRYEGVSTWQIFVKYFIVLIAFFKFIMHTFSTKTASISKNLTSRPSEPDDPVHKRRKDVNEQKEEKEWTIDVFDVFVQQNHAMNPREVCLAFFCNRFCH